MKVWIAYLSIFSASGLVMVTLYNSLVDAHSWGADIPSSIEAARMYYLHVDPRNFFQFIAPVNQLLITLAIAIFWKEGNKIRYYFAASFLLYAVIFLLTLYYFIPRDVVLFSTQNNQHSWEEVRTALQEWKAMNWVRSVVGLGGVLCTCAGVDRYYRNNVKTSVQ